MGNYATGTAPCGGGDGSLRAGSAPQLELLHRGRELAAADRAFARGGQILHGPVRSAQAPGSRSPSIPRRPLRDGNSGQVSNAGR